MGSVSFILYFLKKTKGEVLNLQCFTCQSSSGNKLGHVYSQPPRELRAWAASLQSELPGDFALASLNVPFVHIQRVRRIPRNSFPHSQLNDLFHFAKL